MDASINKIRFLKKIARLGLEPRSKAPRAPMLATTLPGYKNICKILEYNYFILISFIAVE